MLPDALQSRLSRSEALQQARQSVDRLDAQRLLAFVSGCTTANLLAYPERELSLDESVAYSALVARRAQGEPLAYLTGMAGFYDDLIQVSPAVLVPRPETEALVTWALDLLEGVQRPYVADLGTGSGAIALALAGARVDMQVLAIDVSPEAIAMATANRDRLGRSHVAMRCASWFAGVSDDAVFDLIISNPPYIEANDPHLMGDGVRYEPLLALTDGGNGLSAYEVIAVQAWPRLKPGGWLLVEHGHDQAEAIALIWQSAGMIGVETRKDLSGNPRMTVGRKPRAVADDCD